MTDAKRRSLISAASTKIWTDFNWLWEHTSTTYASSEYPVNKNYSIFAFEESDDTTEITERWITITLERYNDKGRCVDDFVVSTVTGTLSKTALTSGITHLLRLLEQKIGTIDMLEEDIAQTFNTNKNLTDGEIDKIKWLFKATDFSNAQIGRMFDVSAVAISKIRNEDLLAGFTI